MKVEKVPSPLLVFFMGRFCGGAWYFRRFFNYTHGEVTESTFVVIGSVRLWRTLHNAPRGRRYEWP